MDPDYVFVEMVLDSDATLPDLPSNATVNVRVTSVNDAGESAPSDAAQIVVP